MVCCLRHVQGTAQVEKPARSDAVDAALVFLDLLEGEPDGLDGLFLAHAKQVAAQAHPGTERYINRVGATAGSLLFTGRRTRDGLAIGD